MSLRNRFNNPQVLIRTGLLFLILGSLALRFLQRSTGFSGNLTDGITGLLYGVSIACMLLGIRRNARRRSGKESGPCA